jgi:hypothetical protein
MKIRQTVKSLLLGRTVMLFERKTFFSTLCKERWVSVNLRRRSSFIQDSEPWKKHILQRDVQVCQVRLITLQLYAGRLTVTRCCSSPRALLHVALRYSSFTSVHKRGHCIGRQLDGGWKWRQWSWLSGDTADLHLGGARFETLDWFTGFPDAVP